MNTLRLLTTRWNRQVKSREQGRFKLRTDPLTSLRDTQRTSAEPRQKDTIAMFLNSCAASRRRAASRY
jgi:hypothetical protein